MADEQKKYLGESDWRFISTLLLVPEFKKYLKITDFDDLIKNYPTNTEMAKAIEDALKDVTGIKFDGPYADYNTLVATVTDPKAGTIYLVTNSGSVPNASDEYFWNTTTSKFELFGTTTVDLTPYLKKESLVELTESEVQSIWDKAWADNTSTI